MLDRQIYNLYSTYGPCRVSWNLKFQETHQFCPNFIAVSVHHIWRPRIMQQFLSWFYRNYGGFSLRTRSPHTQVNTEFGQSSCSLFVERVIVGQLQESLWHQSSCLTRIPSSPTAVVLNPTIGLIVCSACIITLNPGLHVTGTQLLALPRVILESSKIWNC